MLISDFIPPLFVIHSDRLEACYHRRTPTKFSIVKCRKKTHTHNMCLAWEHGIQIKRKREDVPNKEEPWHCHCPHIKTWTHSISPSPHTIRSLLISQSEALCHAMIVRVKKFRLIIYFGSLKIHTRDHRQKEKKFANFCQLTQKDITRIFCLYLLVIARFHNKMCVSTLNWRKSVCANLKFFCSLGWLTVAF